MARNKALIIRADEPFHEMVKDEAEKRQLSVSSLVRLAVVEYLNKAQNPDLKIGRPKKND